MYDEPSPVSSDLELLNLENTNNVLTENCATKHMKNYKCNSNIITNEFVGLETDFNNFASF